jgi:hypothetical protein
MSNDKVLYLIREAKQLALNIQSDKKLVSDYPALDYVIGELGVMEQNVIFE